jgi:hypothetical protein
MPAGLLPAGEDPASTNANSADALDGMVSAEVAATKIATRIGTPDRFMSGRPG